MKELKNELLDEELSKESLGKKEYSYRQLFAWWEDKRLSYNLIVGGFGCFVFALLAFLNPTILERGIFWIFCSTAITYAVVGNICYCLSWSLDSLLKMFSNYYLEEETKQSLFWMGVIISILPMIGILLLGFFITA